MISDNQGKRPLTLSPLAGERTGKESAMANAGERKETSKKGPADRDMTITAKTNRVGPAESDLAIVAKTSRTGPAESGMTITEKGANWKGPTQSAMTSAEEHDARQ